MKQLGGGKEMPKKQQLQLPKNKLENLKVKNVLFFGTRPSARQDQGGTGVCSVPIHVNNSATILRGGQGGVTAPISIIFTVRVPAMRI